MKTPIYLATLWLLSSLYACIPPSHGKEQPNKQLKEGEWRATMTLPDAKLPFEFVIDHNDSAYTLTVKNGIEQIPINDIQLVGDSFHISLPIFQSALIGRIQNDTLLQGQWHNYSKGNDYTIPFQAHYSNASRFNVNTSSSSTTFSGKWEVTFSKDSSFSCKAIGLFQQQGNKLSGTFITETGDYRFLDGNVKGDSMFLSCFDGSHAFLFKAVNRNNALFGTFWSGKHWKESWVAIPNDSFLLTHPDSLTFLKPGYDGLAFSFPNLDSAIVSLSDQKYDNKVVIVQIMGSWCPNCADETILLNALYDQYHEQGLEIIGLAYEKTDDFGKSVAAVNKMKTHLGADYDFLIAGLAKKKKAQKTLPMLNHIMSYPTCIFIDRNKIIRKIHTGFYGPGSGEFYHVNSKDLSDFTAQLIEQVPT
jgi:peroxiredoxin